MDASLNEFLKYYNDFIKKNGFEPTAYDVNFWITNFFKSKKNKSNSNHNSIPKSLAL